LAISSSISAAAPELPDGTATFIIDRKYEMFDAYSTAPLLIVQDFARDFLVEKQAETYANEFLVQPPGMIRERRQKFEEVYR
jgi:hypothetical protein